VGISWENGNWTGCPRGPAPGPVLAAGTGWSYEALLDLCQRQARVRISGWLLHDYQHIRDIGAWRATAWEIHPVTSIEVWSPEREEWQRLR